MKTAVRQAFVACNSGWPPDRVVADPDLNRSYIEKCRHLGLTNSVGELNVALINLRKGSHLKGLPRSRRTSFANEEEYRFAAEIAARYLERTKGVSLDVIISDPNLVSEFDRMAA